MTLRYDAVDPPRVLVTRAAEDAGPLARGLSRAGFEPVLVPLLERRWHPEAVTAIAEAPADWVVVTSATAAEVVATGAPTAWRDARWAAVGSSTAARLQQLGYRVDLVPPRATAEHLVAALGDLTGQRVIYPRADLASSTTMERLEAAGATVVDAVAYTNVAPHHHAAHLKAVLPIDATTLLSGSAANRLAEAVPDWHERLGQIVCIGPSTEAVARARDLPVHAIAAPHSAAGVVAALVDLFSR